MLITINGVELSKAPKGYMVAEVKYLKDGQEKTQKIMSFAAPDVYTKLAAFTTFPQDVNVVMKKEGNFWNWKAIEEPGEASKATALSASSARPGKVLGSNFETPEERARRQVYIVRQSSFTSALELLKAQNPKVLVASVDDVISVAKQIEAYVFDVLPVGESNEPV